EFNSLTGSVRHPFTSNCSSWVLLSINRADLRLSELKARCGLDAARIAFLDSDLQPGPVTSMFETRHTDAPVFHPRVLKDLVLSFCSDHLCDGTTIARRTARLAACGRGVRVD
ncbi:hypothetical protein ACWGTO_32965, partial [Mesorhizobium sp. PL10]